MSWSGSHLRRVAARHQVWGHCWRKVQPDRGFGRGQPAGNAIHDLPVDERSGANVTILELDHRSCGSLDVSLFWNPETNALFVQVIDWGEEDDFSVPVEAASALQAFHHPYAYAPPRRSPEPASALLEAVRTTA